MIDVRKEDLMIGDLVYNNRIHQVQKIILDDFKAILFEEESVDEFEPIPLTPEILDLNCIEYSEDDDMWYIQDGVCTTFEMQEYEAPYTFGDFAVIRYVHELQHALRLCGLSELADNFKIK